MLVGVTLQQNHFLEQSTSTSLGVFRPRCGFVSVFTPEYQFFEQFTSTLLGVFTPWCRFVSVFAPKYDDIRGYMMIYDDIHSCYL